MRARSWCLKMKCGYDAHVCVRPTGAINRARTVGVVNAARTVGVVNAARTVGAAYPHFIFKEHHLARTVAPIGGSRMRGFWRFDRPVVLPALVVYMIDAAAIHRGTCDLHRAGV